MNNKLNLWKSSKDEQKLKSEEITEERILHQSQKCEKRFDDWHHCIKIKGWNDQNCFSVMRPKYESCIVKRNLMQTILDERLDKND
jgi:hypothetical protein